MNSLSIVPIYDVKLITDERKAIQLLLESESKDPLLYIRIVNCKIIEFSFQSDIVYQHISMLINICRIAPIDSVIDITTTISYLLNKLFTQYLLAFQLLHININSGDSPIAQMIRQIIANKGKIDEISTRRSLIDLIKIQLSAYQYREIVYINYLKPFTLIDAAKYIVEIMQLMDGFDKIFSEISNYTKLLI